MASNSVRLESADMGHEWFDICLGGRALSLGHATALKLAKALGTMREELAGRFG